MRDSYLRGLSRDPHLIPLELDDLDDFCVPEEEYKQNPEKYFAAGSYHEDDQIFIHDLEGAFELKAYSFQAFYQDWLAFLLDTERFQQKLEEWRRIKNR